MMTKISPLAGVAGLLLALMMVAAALGDQGPCKGGFWPDGYGCCPIVVKGNAYYRDSNNKCYPKEIKYNLFYADSNGCYPDEYGNYLASDKSCPKEQKCYPSCEKPNEYQYTTTQEYYPPKTTSEEYKTTTEQYYPPKTTSEEHKTTSKQHKTTTQKHKTTSQYYPQTTSEEYMTTTQEYYPPKTSSEEYKTTSQQHNNQCPYNKEKDGNGCCPREIDGMWFYRDGRGCYPIKTYGGVLYADGNGCYPDDKGSYLQAGAKCPYERQCKPECDGNAYN